MRPPRAVSIYTTLALALSAACGEDARAVADSDATAYSAQLVMASSPEVEFTNIGNVEADSHGRVYVTDLPNTVRVLDDGGKQIRTIGKAGRGPGEFNRISDVQLGRGDTLMLFDPVLARATFYRLDGEKPSRMHGMESGPGERIVKLFRYDDGTLVAHFRGIMGPDYADPMGRPEFLRTFDNDGHLTGSSLELQGPEMFSLRDGGGMTYGFPRFARRTFIHLGPDKIYTLWSDSASLRVFDRSGRLISIIHLRVPISRTPISPAVYDTVAAGIGSPSIRPTVRSLIESRWRTWPLFDGFLIDDRDGIWVKPTTRDGSNRWHRLASDGTVIGHITLPEGAMPRLIKHGRMYCVLTDENDVQTIAAYAIVSSTPKTGEQR
jgi:hypothetical protein